MVNEAALKDLRAKLRGAVITPADAGYDEARRIHMNSNVGPTV
jgi:hypothetical protein